MKLMASALTFAIIGYLLSLSLVFRGSYWGSRYLDFSPLVILNVCFLVSNVKILVVTQKSIVK